MLVERGDEALVRMRGASPYYPGRVDWREVKREFWRRELDSFEAWAFDAWKSWLGLVAADPAVERARLLDRIPFSCPRMDVLDPEVAELRAGLSLTEALDEVYQGLFGDPFEARVAFLLGRYVGHPVVEAIRDAEIVVDTGEGVAFDVVVRRRELNPPSANLEAPAPPGPELAVLNLVSGSSLHVEGTLRSALMGIDQAVDIGLPLSRRSSAVLTDVPTHPVFAVVPAEVRVIDVRLFEAPALLQDLLHPWER